MTGSLSKNFRTFPFNLPMTVAAVGTVATIWCGKRYHIAFGIAWLALSLLHGVQHAGKMKRDASRILPHASNPSLQRAHLLRYGQFR